MNHHHHDLGEVENREQSGGMDDEIEDGDNDSVLSEDHDDHDGPVSSDYDGSVLSDLTSIRSDLLPFEFDNGRRYQGLIANRYGLPNDEAEQNREALKHRLFSDYIFEGRHFMAPIGPSPQKIVDLGCGAGFWALDVAELYPSARVIGCDISPIQPRWTPSNLEFHIEDLDDELSPWSFVYQQADLIFIRCVIQTMRNSRLFLQRVLDNLKPGGWIECQEIILPVVWEDGSEAADHPFSVLFDRMSKGSFAKVYGWEVKLPRRLPAALREAGFINVSEKHTHVPIGRWHLDRRMREMGMINHSVCFDWVAAVLNKEKELDMSQEEKDAFAEEIFEAMENPRCRALLDWASICAQKPF